MGSLPATFLKFLGTAGARFVMIKQLRHSGGIWIRCDGTNILVDPGPGALVRCASSRPKLDPASLDAIILTHRHLDHSGDINVMIEAMTEGGFKKRGMVFCPEDALSGDPVILKYLRGFPERIQTLEAGTKYRCGNFSFETSMAHKHPVETYGLRFSLGGKRVAYMVDTAMFPGLFDFYKAQLLLVGVVLVDPRPEIFHLSLPEVASLVAKIKPEEAILTHFGMRMLKAGPAKMAEKLSRELECKVTAAYDGMVITF